MENYRIIKAENEKFYVQKRIRENSFFYSEKWECCITYSGQTAPFGFDSFESAMKNLLFDVEIATIKNSR